MPLRVRIVQKRAAAIMSLNVCPQREKEASHQHRSPAIKRAEVQTTLERQGDREAGSEQSDVRSASSPHLRRNRSARDAQHGQSEILAGNWSKIGQARGEKVGPVLIVFVFIPVHSTCKHFRLMTDESYFLRWKYLDKTVFLVQQSTHTSLGTFHVV